MTDDGDDVGGWSTLIDLAVKLALWITGIVIVLHFAWKYW